MVGETDDVEYHLAVGDEDVAETVLLPGDPERVEVITGTWDDADLVADHREYRTATGTVDGTPVSATSTGIGSPSAAIAVEELARVGARTFIRVGSCGAIQPGMEVGDL
ncbi:MAG: uridine phosphorylase, partial [Halobacteriales archaeon]